MVGTTCQFLGTNTAEIRLNEIGADKIINLTPGQIYDAVTNQTQMPLKIKCQQGVAPRITFQRNLTATISHLITGLPKVSVLRFTTEVRIIRLIQRRG